MNLPNLQKYIIRGAELTIDIENESGIGIYSDPFWQAVANGQYEKVTFDFLQNLHKSGFEYLLDIGAATGCMSLYAASTGLRVIAVEPQELVYSALVKNVNLNPSLKARISLEYALVCGSNESFSISQSFTPGAAGPLRSGELTSTSITLVELLQRCPKNSKVAIKIDIEGAEFPLFKDRTTMSFLASRKPLIYVALHPGFKRPLANNASSLSRTLWRLQAAQDAIKFFFNVFLNARIQVASSSKKIGLVGLLTALARDEKDYILTFYSGASFSKEANGNTSQIS
jgi:FkbM family methyltransferase